MAKIELTDGSPVPPDRSHVELLPNGQQKGYIVLSAEERAKGFVKPVRRSYIHQKCGTLTTMGLSLAETYARDPNFYSGTFCCGCGTHFGLSEFHWEDGEPMDTVEQEGWGILKAAEKEGRRLKRIAELERELASLKAAQP